MINPNWILLKDKAPENGDMIFVSDDKDIGLAIYKINSDFTYFNGQGFGGYEWEWDFIPTHWAKADISLPTSIR
jgi:hypothetical protein